MSAKVAQVIQLREKTYPFMRMNIATHKKHIEFVMSSAQTAKDMGVGKEPDPVAAMQGITEMAEIVYECVLWAMPNIDPDALHKALYDTCDPKAVADLTGLSLSRFMVDVDYENIKAAYQAVMTGIGIQPTAGE